MMEPLTIANQPPKPLPPFLQRKSNNGDCSCHLLKADKKRLVDLCGFGYWLQGFRCFPWLALNFCMAQGLNLHPSTLQLVQNLANLPMVAKPLYGIISDAVYFGNAHRLPYISVGALLQILSWGLLATMPVTGGTYPALMACILLSNLGASLAEVATDALITEFSNREKGGELQSFAFMALAAGGILGNLTGEFLLQRNQQPQTMFLMFCVLLSLQLWASLTTRETSMDSMQSPEQHHKARSISGSLSQMVNELCTAISKEEILYPLSWVVASVAMVPIQSGTLFCYQTQSLKINPSIIGLSKVIGQLMVLFMTVAYNRYLKQVPTRSLISWVQTTYALSLLSDLFLVKQLNIMLGISNDIYVLSMSALGEAIAQFKLFPFSVLLAKLCPKGCEGSLPAFLASALCASSIFSGFLGVGLAILMGVSSEDYTSLPAGIFLQFLAALAPLGWVSYLLVSDTADDKKRKAKNGNSAYREQRELNLA